MIELAKYLIVHADDLEEPLKDNYYSLLQLIMNRGEFQLNQICFNNEFEYLLTKNLKKKTKLTLKLQIALNY